MSYMGGRAGRGWAACSGPGRPSPWGPASALRGSDVYSDKGKNQGQGGKPTKAPKRRKGGGANSKNKEDVANSKNKTKLDKPFMAKANKGGNGAPVVTGKTKRAVVRQYSSGAGASTVSMNTGTSGNGTAGAGASEPGASRATDAASMFVPFEEENHTAGICAQESDSDGETVKKNVCKQCIQYASRWNGKAHQESPWRFMSKLGGESILMAWASSKQSCSRDWYSAG